MSRTIRIGTRKSKLALAQTYLVRDAIKKVDPSIEVELVPLSTKGDKILYKPLLSFGGKGVFIEEFETKMKEGEIDIAVHSSKDMPMELMEGLSILSVLPRADARDVLITKKGFTWNPEVQTVIGTSSLRRKMQLERFGKVECRDLRGNVNTRLQKLEDGLYDGIVLALAGLKRLGLDSDERFSFHPFATEEFIPAGGQGIIAVEGREDSEFAPLLKELEDKTARLELQFERQVLSLLNAGCHEPIGVFSRIQGENLTGYLFLNNQIYTVKGCKKDWDSLAFTLSKAGRKTEK